MKKNMLIGIIIFAVIIIGGIIVGVSLGGSNSDDMNIDSSSNGSSSNSESANTSKSNKYASDVLRESYKLEELNGKILDIKSSGKDLYLSSKDKVYGGYDFEEMLTTSKDIKSMFFVKNSTMILEDSSNKKAVYGEYFESIGADPKFKEIEGINLDNAIYASESVNNNSFNVIRNVGNTFVVDKYELDQTNNVTNKTLNVPLYLDIGGEGNKVNNIKQIFIESDSKLIFVLSDGRVFDTGLSITFLFKDNYVTLSSNTKVAMLDNVEKVYGYGSSMEFRRPLFEKVGDKKNLYTYTDDVSMSTLGTPEDQYKITIALPTEYTTDDIKNVVIHEDMLIEFNDKSIYTASEEDISKLEYNSTLTDYNKNNKLKKIALMNSYIVALMDDKCVYEIDF